MRKPWVHWNGIRFFAIICCLWSHLRDVMLICALPWLSALCCPVLLLCFYFSSCKPPFLCSFLCVYCFLFLLHACRCLHLALIAKKPNQIKQKTNQPNTNSGSHKSSSLNVPVAVDDLLSAPAPLLGLLWLVAPLLGLGCVVWTEQFTQIWPSCRQVSFLWEVLQWNPRGERFFGGWPITTTNVSSYPLKQFF